MIFVATVVLGSDFFNTLSRLLDITYVSYIAVPAVPLLIIIHMVFAARKIPIRFQEQRKAWSLARGMRSFEIWSWIFQIITGVAILILASVHIWLVSADYPIRAAKSAERIAQFHFIIFYVALLIFGEFHAGLGLYRQFVKWGWFDRHSVNKAIKVIGVCIVGLGVLALVIFSRLGGAP
jgi:fumarate reductase subunit C